MILYIANLTQQIRVFHYRLPEKTGMHQQKINIGTQIKVAGDLSRGDIDYILAQHSKYGMVAADEVDRARKHHVTVCYSIDKPVNFEKVRKMMAHNHGVLTERGVQLRKEAAVIANHVVGNPTPDVSLAVSKFDVDIVEDEKQNGPNTEVNDHITVSASPGSRPPRANRGRNSRST